MSEQEDRQKLMAQRLQQMVQVTRRDDKDTQQKNLAGQFLNMMEATKKLDNDAKQQEWAAQFAKMMQQTRSFDSERDRLQKIGETKISNAFAQMIHMTHKLEQENRNQFEFPPDVNIEHFPSIGDKFFHSLIQKLPKRIRLFPQALRRNPRAVIKYFLAMIIGRVLAITLYVIAAFIPALPIPDSVTGVVGRAPNFLGAALNSMRGAVVEFSPQAIMTVVANIPTDINKLLQKVGEFFQYYGRRAGKFFVEAIRHPKWGAREIWAFMHCKSSLLLRIGKGACGVAFSFFVIKLAMIFLLPLFGGIAITVLGFKISIVLIVVVRMAISTGSEILGRLIGKKFIVMGKYFYEHPEEIIALLRKAMEDWKSNWINEDGRPKQ